MRTLMKREPNLTLNIYVGVLQISAGQRDVWCDALSKRTPQSHAPVGGRGKNFTAWLVEAERDCLKRMLNYLKDRGLIRKRRAFFLFYQLLRNSTQVFISLLYFIVVFFIFVAEGLERLLSFTMDQWSWLANSRSFCGGAVIRSVFFRVWR